MSIVTVNKGSQGAPFDTSSPADPSDGWVWFADFITEADGGDFTLTAMAQTDSRSGTLGNTEASVNKAISKNAVFGDLTDGESFAFVCRIEATTARAAADEISFGIAEDVDATIGDTATHCGFHITQGATAAADNIAVKYDDAAAAFSENFTPANTAAIADFDMTAYNEYGFLLSRQGSQYTARFFVNGVELGNGHKASANLPAALYTAVYSAAGKGAWAIDYFMQRGVRNA